MCRVHVSGEPVFQSCLTKVEKVLYKKVVKASEAADMDFYAFSYYYDRAVDLGVIGTILWLLPCRLSAGRSTRQHFTTMRSTLVTVEFQGEYKSRDTYDISIIV